MISILLISDTSFDLVKTSRILCEILDLSDYNVKANFNEPVLPEFELFVSKIRASKKPVFSTENKKYDAVVIFTQVVLSFFEPSDYLKKNGSLIINTSQDLSNISEETKTVCLNISRMINIDFSEEGLLAGLSAVFTKINYRKLIHVFKEEGYDDVFMKKIDHIYESVRREVLRID